MTKSRSALFSRQRAPFFVLGVSLIITTLATYYFWAAEKAKDSLRFQNIVESAQNAIVQRVDTYISILRAGTALFAASEAVTNEEFKKFVERLRVQEKYPGIQGIGYAKRISAGERERVVRNIRTDGRPDFDVWPLQGQEEFYAIVHLEPADRRNLAAIGYDMFSEPVRRAAMERARDMGEPGVSQKVTLVQEIDPIKQSGFLIYLPVYRTGARPALEEDRRREIDGFVYSPFRADDLLEGIFGKKSHPLVAFDVYDGTTVAPELLLRKSPFAPKAGDPHPEFREQRTIDVGGAPWTVVFQSTASFERGSRRYLTPIVFLGGLLTSLVLFGLALLESRSYLRSKRVSAELARRLAQSQILYDLTAAANHMSALADLLAHALSALRRSVHADRVSILLFDRDGVMRFKAWDNLSETYRKAVEGHSPWVADALDPQPLLISDMETDPGVAAYRPVFSAEGIRALGFFPLMFRGRLLGKFMVYFNQPHDFTPDETQIIQTIAHHVATGIEREKNHHDLQESEERFRRLAESTKVIPWEADLETGQFTYVGPQATDILGFPPSAWYEKDFWPKQMHPEDRDEALRYCIESSKKFLNYDFEYRMLASDGRIVWIRDFVSVITLENEKKLLRGFLIDITEDKRARQKIEESEARFRLMADTAPVLIWVANPDKLCAWVNKPWLEFTGKSLEQQTGEGWSEGVHKDDLPAWADAYYAAFEARKEFKREYRLRRYDGEYRWVLDNGVPRFGPDGQFEGYIGSCIEIHDRKTIEKTLTEQAEQLFRSNKELEQFAFVSSHDLKEPLRKMASYAQLLEIENKGKLGGDSERYIANILSGADRMRSLIDDLLAFSRLGRTEINLQTVDLNKVLNQTLSDLESLLLESQAQVTHDQLPIVLADPSQMGQLLQNLISNGIKFRVPGSPSRIHIGAERKNTEWVFYVRDNGIGFEPKYAEQIFKVFQRLHGKDKYPGTGIGLAICRKIIDRHQGRIWAHSEPGKGSTFYFSMPIDMVLEAQALPKTIA